MALEDQLLRYLIRTRGSGFCPIIVKDHRRADEIFDFLRPHFKVASGVVHNLATLFALVLVDYDTDLLILSIRGTLEGLDLYACNLGRDDIAGAGYPILWVMTREQRNQIAGCPDLWSCRDAEIVDEGA